VTVTYFADAAWLSPPGQPARIARSVLIEIDDGRFTAVRPDTPAGVAGRARHLPGLTIPGLANAHSHAFHRALRGRTHAGRGTFWTWRERMYAIAGCLDPDSYHRLARAVFGEMVLAGVTCVGEFHYLHHQPNGRPYDDPNAMGHALLTAASEAGLRITLLDALYLTSSVDGRPLTEAQRRFGDADATRWAERVGKIATGPHAKVGVAAHSVRAVPVDALPVVAELGADRPLHFHLSEQRAENDAALARHGRTPTALLGDYDVLSPTSTAVHATHLTDEDRTLLGDTDTAVCFCPTTERDLADGIGPARALYDSGSPLCLGSDSHAVIDMFEEARALELNERLRTEMRGHFSAEELVAAATVAGHRCLGWPDAGVIAPGARADLVTIGLDSPRVVGADPIAVPAFAATASDVRHVVVDGHVVVRDGRHLLLDVPGELAASIAAVIS
jgi:formiminoglutamate deiminase